MKFVAVLKGACWIERPGRAGERLNAGDVCLIGSTAYTVSSRPGVPSIDGMQFYEGTTHETLRLNGDDTVMLGGGIAVAREEAGFLLDMLPDFAIVPSSPGGAASVAAVLKLLDAEIARDAIGSDTVVTRLAEVLMIEAIRARTVSPVPGGWLDALAEPRLRRALALIHDEIAEPWTVARLASAVGMSRSAFASLFTRHGRPAAARLRQILAPCARTRHARQRRGQRRAGGDHRRLCIAKRVQPCLSPRVRHHPARRLRGLYPSFGR